jgi:hypothetical protein
MGERIMREENLEMAKQQSLGMRYQKPENIAKLEREYKSLQDFVGFLINDAERVENDHILSKAKDKPKAAWRMIKKNKGGHQETTNKLEEIFIEGAKEKDIRKIANHLCGKFMEPEAPKRKLPLFNTRPKKCLKRPRSTSATCTRTRTQLR